MNTTPPQISSGEFAHRSECSQLCDANQQTPLPFREGLGEGQRVHNHSTPTRSATLRPSPNPSQKGRGIRRATNSGTNFPLRRAPSNSNGCRQGMAMVWFAVLLFAIFGMAALVADLGQVFVVRRQMQTAVGSAALEGLRLRDSIPHCDEAASGMDNETYRRARAGTFVSQTIPNGIAVAVPSGGGTPLTASDGTQTNFAPYQSLALGSTYTGSPALHPNYTSGASDRDAIDGDMVAGEYLSQQSDGTPNSHLEFSDYSRQDFTPYSSATSNNNGVNTATNSFLVRMRMSGENLTDGAGTAGPTIPFLFGRAMGASGSNPAATWNRLASGTVVRATAIADAQPAFSVGTFSGTVTLSDGTAATIEGFIPGIQLRADTDPSWGSSSTTTYSPWALDSSGQFLTISATTNSGTISATGGGSATTIGNLATLSLSSGQVTSQVCVGMRTQVTTSGTMPITTGFAPVVSSFVNANDHTSHVDVIVGFARVSITSNGSGNYNIQRWVNYVAPQNASAAFPLQTGIILNESFQIVDAQSVMTFFRSLAPPAALTSSETTPKALPLLAPALVRSIAIPSN